jgi:hypothetical protein
MVKCNKKIVVSCTSSTLASAIRDEVYAVNSNKKVKYYDGEDAKKYDS